MHRTKCLRTVSILLTHRKRPPAPHPCSTWQIFGAAGRLQNLSREARWRLRWRRKGEGRERGRGEGDGGGGRSRRGTARGRMRAKHALVRARPSQFCQIWSSLAPAVGAGRSGSSRRAGRGLSAAPPGGEQSGALRAGLACAGTPLGHTCTRTTRTPPRQPRVYPRRANFWGVNCQG